MTKKAKKPVTTLATIIENNNAAYAKASPAKRRVMIAKDALTQIKAGAVKPRRGAYVVTNMANRNKPLQPQLLNGDIESCTCCAKGTLFVSCVRLSNRYTGDPNFIGSGAINELLEWPEYNYHTIESIFERWSLDGKVRQKLADKWYAKYPISDNRLVAILRNIIKNRGTFKLSDI